jgi:hypothetical protein
MKYSIGYVVFVLPILRGGRFFLQQRLLDGGLKYLCTFSATN